MCLLRMPSMFSCRMLMLRRLFLGATAVVFCGVLYEIGEGVRLGGVGICGLGVRLGGGEAVGVLGLGERVMGVVGGEVCGVCWLDWTVGGAC